jgi:hypothetical protein
MKFFAVRMLAIYSVAFLWGHASDASRSLQKLRAQEPAKAGAANQLVELQRYIPRDALILFQLNVRELRENKALVNVLEASPDLQYLNHGWKVSEVSSADWMLNAVLMQPPELDPATWSPLLMVSGSAVPLAPVRLGKEEPKATSTLPKFTIPELGLTVSIAARSEEEALQNWHKRVAIYEPNPNTRIIGQRGRVFLQAFKPKAEVRDAGWHSLLPLQNINASTLVGAIDLARLRSLPMDHLGHLHPLVNHKPTNHKLLYQLSQKADQAVIGVNLRQGMQVTAIIQTSDAAQTAALKEFLEGQLQSIRERLPKHLATLQQFKFADPEVGSQFLAETHSLFNSIQLVQKGNLFRLTMQADQKLIEALANVMSDPNVAQLPVLQLKLPELPESEQTKAGSTKSP